MPDGSVMSESAAITLLLADITGKDSLVPPGNAKERGKFLRWLVFIVANIYPTFTYADDPSRFVSVNAARDPFRAATDAYAQRLWRQIEREAGSPWFLGERFSALDIYIGIMTRWRPKRGWFESETPHLFAIARRADQVPELGRGVEAQLPVGLRPRMASVGIVGGLGVGATVHYYEKITGGVQSARRRCPIW